MTEAKKVTGINVAWGIVVVVFVGLIVYLSILELRYDMVLIELLHEIRDGAPK